MNRILPGGETVAELATSSKFNIGIESITIGQSSGLDLQGINNVFLGNRAGFNANTVYESIFIGMNAGDNIISGSRNIIIGDETSINYNKLDTLSLGYNNSINNYSIGTGLDIVSIGNCNLSYGYNINSYGTNSISYGNYINTTNSIIFIDNFNTDNNNIDNIIVKNITGNTDTETSNILYKRYDIDNTQLLNIIDYNSDIILKFRITSNINFKFSLGFYKDDIERNIFTIDNTKLYYNNIEYDIQESLLYEYDNIFHIINKDYETLSIAIHINPEYDELLNINNALFTKNILNNNINSKTINNIRILYDLDNISNTSNIFYNSNISNISNTSNSNIINTNIINTNIINTNIIINSSNSSNSSNNNLILFDNYKFNNINSGLSFDNFIISINNLDDYNYNNLAYGKNISIKGTKNICIGNKINTIGYNSILIGDNISYYDSNIYNYNNVQNSIIIGNNNLNNNYSKNSIIIGNNNFNNIIDDIYKYEIFLKKNPIIIGSNLNNIDYTLNIADTILKYDDNITEKQIILSGLNSYNNKTLPVAIGYSNIEELNIINDNYKLYVKDGGIYTDKIYSSNYYGNGENLTNINISDITTTSLKEGSNLYFTRERVEDVISSIWTINEDNIQYCNIKIYNSNIDTEYIISSSNSLGLRTKFDLTTNQIELNLNGFNYQQNNSSSWSISSDERIKYNIEEANYDICYDNIKNLPLKRFRYKEGIDCLLSKDKTKLGFIAQDIKIKYPKNVEYKPIKINNEYINDCLSIDLEQINMTLYGSVKKLIELNDNKENRIKYLETYIIELKNRIEILEKI